MRFTPALLASPLLVITAAAAASPGAIWGTARAQDGDSMMVDGVRVRLFGIDAPELDQPCTRAGRVWACGEEAAAELSRLVTGRKVMCTVVDTDQYGRRVARCSTGATDINRAMIEAGLAVAYRSYSLDYVGAETRAKTAHLGLWAGTFELTSQHRFDERAMRSSRPRTAPRQSAQVTFKNGCNIKGNRNRRGQWIYHLPGMPYYEQTRPEEIFCTEAQAQAAGYRRAIVK